MKQEIIHSIRQELRGALLGQEKAIDQLIICLMAHGHLLLEGPPGVGKTLLASSVAKVFDCDFRRIQMTPDLMPADIVGVSIFHPGKEEFTFRKGPVFTDILLADELNRAPPRTQAALLEAMQEVQVTVDGTTYPLSKNFTVIATQNPNEFEGTYGLPEAQLDRFMMKIRVGYPTKQITRQLLQNCHHKRIHKMVSKDDLTHLQGDLDRVDAKGEILDYITDIIDASHHLPEFASGASPRACKMLLDASKGHALLHERNFVTPEDVFEMALPVLGHRLNLSADAKIDGLNEDTCVEKLLQMLTVPR